MKKIITLGLSLITLSLLGQEAAKDSTQKYRTEKAWEAIIYDRYQEAMPYEKELPDAYKQMIKKFGMAEKDVNFYTAVRMDRFVEKVGNNIILLRPNFFLYLTDEEQASHIGVQLQRIRAGDNRELEWKNGKYNPSKKFLRQFKQASIALAGLALAAVYHKELIKGFHMLLPTLKSAACSTAGKIIGAAAAANLIAWTLYEREQGQLDEHQEFLALDTMGADEWISVKEKQIVWGKNKTFWPVYQWYKLQGLLYLNYMPEVNLARYKEHVKNNQSSSSK